MGLYVVQIGADMTHRRKHLSVEDLRVHEERNQLFRNVTCKICDDRCTINRIRNRKGAARFDGRIAIVPKDGNSWRTNCDKYDLL